MEAKGRAGAAAPKPRQSLFCINPNPQERYMSGAIEVEIANNIAWLTIDNEARRNALTQAMWQSLAAAVTAQRSVKTCLVEGS